MLIEFFHLIAYCLLVFHLAAGQCHSIFPFFSNHYTHRHIPIKTHNELLQYSLSCSAPRLFYFTFYDSMFFLLSELVLGLSTFLLIIKFFIYCFSPIFFKIFVFIIYSAQLISFILFHMQIPIASIL